MNKKIKEYWEKRAKQNVKNPKATTNDVYLRDLEIDTLIKTLKELQISPDNNVLDVGCGDGYSTLKLAEAFPKTNFLGMDYSENMIKTACLQLEYKPEIKNRVIFLTGDATEIEKVCNYPFEFIISDRCLINLDSFPSQIKAISQIAKNLKTGGYYLAIENFIEGHENMNKARSSIGLKEIPIRWHNLYFKEDEFVNAIKDYFEIKMWKDFSSSYYFATRLVYSKMCQMKGEEPDYMHEIHQLSINLPWVGQFSPIRMVVLQKKPS